MEQVVLGTGWTVKPERRGFGQVSVFTIDTLGAKAPRFGCSLAGDDNAFTLTTTQVWTPNGRPKLVALNWTVWFSRKRRAITAGKAREMKVIGTLFPAFASARAGRRSFWIGKGKPAADLPGEEVGHFRVAGDDLHFGGAVCVVCARLCLPCGLFWLAIAQGRGRPGEDFRRRPPRLS